MKRILFVDDEANLLDGLRRTLHTMRGEWEMCFVENGQAALQWLENKAFDVIVTDMRMPQMDGAELLSIVRARWPRVVRIILSGQSDRAMILRAVPSTHQFLAKPCEAETLKETIRRSCRLRELLVSNVPRELFDRLERLPSLPDIYEQLVEALADPDVSTERVGHIINQAAGLADHPPCRRQQKTQPRAAVPQNCRCLFERLDGDTVAIGREADPPVRQSQEDALRRDLRP